MAALPVDRIEPGIVLGIETATPHGSVALGSGATVLGELHLFNPQSHAERLLPAVDTLLGSAGFTPEDLSAVAVSIGPGSFTGLRIGVAAAKGLAFSLGIPLFGIPTLEVLAANVSPRPGTVCAVIDARRGEMFAAFFRFRKGGLHKVRGEHIEKIDDLLRNLPSGTLVVGEHPAALLQSPEGGSVLRMPAHMRFPRAAVVALRGALLLSEKRKSDPASVAPLYLRPSDAEANKKKKSQKKISKIPFF